MAERPEDIQCPVCGYYCLGKGGVGCIDKPGFQPKPMSADPPATSRDTQSAADKYNVRWVPSVGKVSVTVRTGDGAPFDFYLTRQEAQGLSICLTLIAKERP